MLVANCPRCKADNMTFDVMAQVYSYTEYEWKHFFEIFCVCRACERPTIYLVALSEVGLKVDMMKPEALIKFPNALNQFFRVERFISLIDNTTQEPPEHLPKDIENAFREGAACYSLRIDTLNRKLLENQWEKV